MAEPILKVARQGYNVKECDPRFLTIDSSKNQFKVHMQGSDTISIPSGTSSQFLAGTPIEHGLSYQPQVLFWQSSISTYDEATYDDRAIYLTDARGDGEYIVWAYNYDSPTAGTYAAQTLTFEYIIFVEPLENVWS
jgi:hypothetical protein